MFHTERHSKRTNIVAVVVIIITAVVVAAVVVDVVDFVTRVLAKVNYKCTSPQPARLVGQNTLMERWNKRQNNDTTHNGEVEQEAKQ